MALTHAKQTTPLFYTVAIFQFLTAVFVLQSCTSHKKIYKSNCDDNITFKHIEFTKLIDSIENYDHQYIEVSGTYKEAKEQSALFDNSMFEDHSNGHALWINFTQDCPLYLSGTHIGLFEYNDGQFTQINNKKIIIRGKIDVRHKGHLGSYKGSIDRVSFVEL